MFKEKSEHKLLPGRHTHTVEKKFRIPASPATPVHLLVNACAPSPNRRIRRNRIRVYFRLARGIFLQDL